MLASDVTQIRHLESQLQEYQFKHATTVPFNRYSLNVVIEAELEKAKRSHASGGPRDSATIDRRAVLLLGLENLNRINQRYGHQFGDVLLKRSGLRTQETLRKADFALRFESRQMAALLTSIGGLSTRPKWQRS